MTIAKTGNKVQYDGDGVTLPFTYGFRFFDNTDLEVILLDASNVETVQTLTTNYTVSNTGTESGGTVTMIVAPAVGEKITIVGAIPETQGTDYTGNDPFPAETHETALDRLTRLQQQTSEISERSLRVTASDTASLEIPFDRASTFLGFDASKNPIVIAGVVTEVPVSTFMATVLDDETAAAARTTLGAGTGDGTLDNVVEDTTPQLGGTLETGAFGFNQAFGANIDSATAMTLGSDGDSVYIDLDVTPITTITGVKVGKRQHCIANGIFTFTNSASIVNESGGDITTALNDTFDLLQIGTEPVVWRLERYHKADGTALVLASNGWDFISSEQTVTLSSKLTVAHGLASLPEKFEVFLICKTTQSPYSVGDVILSPRGSQSGGSYLGMTAQADGTNIEIRTGAQLPAHSDTGTPINLTAASWKYIVKASLV